MSRHSRLALMFSRLMSIDASTAAGRRRQMSGYINRFQPSMRPRGENEFLHLTYLPITITNHYPDRCPVLDSDSSSALDANVYHFRFRTQFEFKSLKHSQQQGKYLKLKEKVALIYGDLTLADDSRTSRTPVWDTEVTKEAVENQPTTWPSPNIEILLTF
ncbi:hypothetical protein EVAR_98772_1 [Eumeta japonica]|uniref:Uncharacterized protein n=1 Tax=Eumeta variegata TaxID=151549 RepID=A0A4C1YVM8_EUMVA|nr:hypothetical protein EVAR_98772_1 [Eumeta japonica]